MKILVISNMYPSKDVPNYGTFVKNFCDQLNDINIDHVKVVMTKSKNKIISYLLYYIKIFFYVLFKKNEYDLIYVHYASHNAVPLLILSKIKKIKIYTNVHGGDIVPQTKTQQKMQKYTKKLLEISNKIIVPSKYFQNLIVNRYNIAENKIVIYPSAGVNEEIFFPYSNKMKNNLLIDEIKIKDDIEYIGFVGRIESGKGWDTFLKAINKIKSEGEFKDKKAIIIGNGVEYNEFTNLVNKLNLSSDIITIKSLPQNELPKVYNSLSVFCFPTEREGESLGLVALEALACSVPVIASDFAAPKDYIIEGYNGYKFEKGNPDELASKIHKYFKLSNEEIDMLRKNAYVTGSNFYRKTLVNKLERVFNE